MTKETENPTDLTDADLEEAEGGAVLLLPAVQKAPEVRELKIDRKTIKRRS
ncbi:MAG: hypothetical protein AAGH74_09820 [Pseudomonadota bacterium]